MMLRENARCASLRRSGGGLSQTLCNDGVCGGIEDQSKMGTRDAEVRFRAVCLAKAPVNYAVALAVDSGFCYRHRH